ncbi:MAG: TrmH family RNA methyltransferase [Chloroflexota bacterium]
MDLFADGVEDARNLRSLQACARLFGAHLYVRPGGRRVAASRDPTLPVGPPLRDLRQRYDLLVALETGDHSQNLFAYRMPPVSSIALVVGNERRGITPWVRAHADVTLHIPSGRMRQRSLNVACAAGLGLAALRASSARSRFGVSCATRPDLLFWNPSDPGELGSALRTAWVLGWDRVLLRDDRGVWFTTDRQRYAAGRAAARCPRNVIRVTLLPEHRAPWQLAVIVTPRGTASAMWRSHARWPASTAVIIVDEASADDAGEAVARLAVRAVRWNPGVASDLDPAAYPQHVIASVALGRIVAGQGG